MWFFKSKAELQDGLNTYKRWYKEATERAEAQAAANQQTQATLGIVSAERDNLKKRLEEARKEIVALSEKVREQTNADILFNALESVGIIREPAKKADSLEMRGYADRARQLDNKLAGARNAVETAPNTLGLFGLGALDALGQAAGYRP